jgi:hypothetical protein
MATEFTIEQLRALDRAIASGTLRAKYGDHEVQYRSIDEMLQVRALMRAVLGLTRAEQRRVFTTFSKGIE